jgi:hypothetical protein
MVLEIAYMVKKQLKLVYFFAIVSLISNVCLIIVCFLLVNNVRTINAKLKELDVESLHALDRDTNLLKQIFELKK